MKSIHYSLKIFPIIVVIIIVLTSCSQKTSVYEIRKEFDYKNVDVSFDSQIKENSGFTDIAETNNLKLLINGQTAEIEVIDKTTGAAWYSNPQNSNRLGNDTSQINISYYENDNLLLYNSGMDSTDKSQYAIEKIENGVRVNYLFGSKPIIYIVPTLLTVERYKHIYNLSSKEDKSILDSYYKFITLKDASDADKGLLTINYPILKKHDIYAAQISTDYFNKDAVFASPYLMKKLQKVFVKTGYTMSDLDKDNKQNNVNVIEDPDYSITASITYKIEGDSLTVSIPNDSITFNGKYTHLSTISLLPLFGAADKTKQGYIFVPDGTGALINLNSKKDTTESFSQTLYSPDMTLSTTKSVDQDYSMQMNMPVYGMKVENDAFLAVIEEGDAIARIDADISGKSNAYNFVNTHFEVGKVAKSDKLTLGVNTGNQYQRNITKSDLSIKYFFLNGEKASYIGMAHRYQKYLLDNDLINKPEISGKMPLFVDIIGAVDKNVSKLGFPVNSVLAMTSYAQCVDILAQLKNKGINDLILQYDGWCNYGIKNTVFNNLKLIKELGGEAKFKELIKYAKENNIKIYPACNFLYVGKNTAFDNFNARLSGTRTLENMVSYTYEMNFATQEFIAENKKVIVSSKKYDDLISNFLKKYDRLDLKTISLSMMGYYLNGDYNKRQVIDRQAAKQEIVEQFVKLSTKKYDVAVNIGNFYTLKGVSFITEAPVTSSNNYIFDYTVPFYQIVLHGIIPYAGEALNMVSDYDDYILKMIETGTIPSFKWTYKDNYELKDSQYNYYSINFKAWIDDAVSAYNTINNAIGDCQNEKIKDHATIAAGVTKTSYDNGTVVYVNYNDHPFVDGSITVKAKGYEVIREVEKIETYKN